MTGRTHKKEKTWDTNNEYQKAYHNRQAVNHHNIILFL